MSKPALLLYMPVIHRGYLECLEKHAGSSKICFLIGRQALSELGEEADYIRRKDVAIRGLPDEVVAGFVRHQGLFGTVVILDETTARVLRPAVSELVGPDEDVTQLAAHHFFAGVPIRYDGTTRLRYDRQGVARVDPVPSASVSSEKVHQILMGTALGLAHRSKDWWLQVGGLISRDGRILFAAWNEAAPDPDMVAILGDPRSLFSRGENSDERIFGHAERRLVARAAREGVSLLGADAYITHFPCTSCAIDLAEAGIRRLFFSQGYSRLESASVLETAGVELIRVVPGTGDVPA